MLKIGGCRIIFALCIVLMIFKSNFCGQICMSCSGVEHATDCTHVSACRNDEVCFMHKYVTEKSAELYDFGCTYPELCVNGYSGAVFGRGLGVGHHMVCQGCCNDTNICNMKVPCVVSSTHNASAGNLPRECEDIQSTKSGVFTIYPDGNKPVKVYCIMANNEKWTVIQRRFNGSVDFYRTWNDYKTGFGSPYGEYWLGNEAIHMISTSSGHMLSIYLEDFENTYKYANYSSFMIGDEYHLYQLTINGFSGTQGVGDSLFYHNNARFSTKDKDNRHHCAVTGHGAWWYSLCGFSNLNGPYLAGPGINATTLLWYSWRRYYSLKKTTMMIRRTPHQ